MGRIINNTSLDQSITWNRQPFYNRKKWRVFNTGSQINNKIQNYLTKQNSLSWAYCLTDRRTLIHPLSRPVLLSVEAGLVGYGWDASLHSFSSQTTA